MGMTIEESLEWLISRKEHYEMDDDCQELAQSLGCAIDIMRKYQKIETLINLWKCNKINQIGYKILEVLEDGNNT